MRVIEGRGYIAYVVDRKRESEAKRGQSYRKVQRWVVEVCHSWFTRFRKFLVRYEKPECSFVALNRLAAAIIAFRRVPFAVSAIDG